MTLYTVYHFPQYMQRRTVAVFFNRSDAESFAIHHGHEYASNGCYVGSFTRKAA
jgi:hypothetical protein